MILQIKYGQKKHRTSITVLPTLLVKSHNLDNLYQNIHKELGKVIEVKNFYITLYNQEKNYLHFPYYVDEDLHGEIRLTQRRVGKGLNRICHVLQ